ncbi:MULTISPECIES: hypothetical protein [Catenuloplanes]|uniref:Uncharacterized protein n=1 Tax=Catenuloplanes niger TaxID=587534 RepID=A0AAE4CXR9_9ACTN|nr:hypothetical protein [Catenuloplanes niger]MDR7326878.1 hypothetical protein [Catenuloplanes niger]
MADAENELTVLPPEESVRRRTRVYFGVDRGSPELPTRILEAVARQAFHPWPDGPAAHVPRVVVEISADLVFSVTDDQPDTLPPGHETPVIHRYGTLAHPARRWMYIQSSGLCTHVDLEVWRDGRGFRQTLHGHHAIAPPEWFAAPAGAGTRATFFLDETYVGRTALTTDPALLDLHHPDCAERPDDVVVRDLRGPGA